MVGIKETLVPIFERMRDRIAVAYLFSSHAKGEAGPRSDIDLAMLLHDSSRNAGLDVRLDLYLDCSRALKRNDIDVVVLNTAKNLFLMNDIVTAGIVLYQCDSGLRQEFEVKVGHDFIDFRDHRKKILGVSLIRNFPSDSHVSRASGTSWPVTMKGWTAPSSVGRYLRDSTRWIPLLTR